MRKLNIHVHQSTIPANSIRCDSPADSNHDKANLLNNFSSDVSTTSVLLFHPYFLMRHWTLMAFLKTCSALKTLSLSFLHPWIPQNQLASMAFLQKCSAFLLIALLLALPIFLTCLSLQVFTQKNGNLLELFQCLNLTVLAHRSLGTGQSPSSQS